jgi:hypothetical protein
MGVVCAPLRLLRVGMVWRLWCEEWVYLSAPLEVAVPEEGAEGQGLVVRAHL